MTHDAKRTNAGPQETDELARMRAALGMVVSTAPPVTMFPEILKEKRCYNCREVKPLEAFVRSKVKRDGYANMCKACKQVKQKEAYTYENARAKYIRQTYGLSMEDYDRMVEEQQHRCAICGATDSQQDAPNGSRKLHIDHDHTTNEVRSLLCSHCNHGIGAFMESPDLLLAAAGYLRRWQARRLGVVV